MNLETLTETLWKAKTEKTPCAPLSDLNPELTIDQAYSISKAILEKHLKANPTVRRVGRKIGLTSRAVQTQFQVHQPDFGYLTSEMLVESGAELPAHALLQGKVEGEVAFVLNQDLTRPDLTVADVIAATEAIFPCIEVIDSRISDWKIKIQDTIADNASAAFFVMGKTPSSFKKITPEILSLSGLTLYRNDDIASTGVGQACMDHPLNAVLWLAKEMQRLGDPLKKGEIILSGALGPVIPCQPGDHIAVEIANLGRVEFRVGIDKTFLTQSTQKLHRARQALKPVSKLTLEKPDLSLAVSYAIQEELVKLDAPVIGYKMGLTSKAKMTQMQVAVPIYGKLTKSMQVEDGATLSLKKFIHPKIEPEIAFILKSPLRGEVTLHEALDACASAHAALEIIDSRYERFEFKLPDVIADNTSASAFVISKKPLAIKNLNAHSFSNLGISLSVNETPTLFASSSAVLGNPLASVCELSKILGHQGLTLPAGSIILTGGATEAIKVAPGSYLGQVAHVGHVRVTFTD